jgi:sugar lactone lactonase YvrE
LAFNANGDLFEADYGTNTIDEFTPDGTQSVFASGLSDPLALALDPSGDLFENNSGTDIIYKFTPGGTQSVFAYGLYNQPIGLACDASGNLFVATYGRGSIGIGEIDEYTPGGAESVFATGLNPVALAFSPVPEPSTFILLGVWVVGLIGYHWRRAK